MTEILIRLTHNLPSIVCLCIAGLLAYKGIDVWFVFVGVGVLIS